MTWERSFFWLRRFNTVAIFLLILLAAYAMISARIEQAGWEQEMGVFPVREKGDIVGEEHETSNGKVVIYLPHGILDAPGTSQADNVSLVHVQSGRQAQLIPAGSSQKVSSWQVLSDGGRAVGFLARVADPESNAEQRWDVVVGNLADLRQTTIARNARYLDAPTIYNGKTLAMIVWPRDDEARLIAVDLGTMRVVRSEPVEVPKPDPDTPEAAPRPAGTIGQTGEAAPENAFE